MFGPKDHLYQMACLPYKVQWLASLKPLECLLPLLNNFEQHIAFIAIVSIWQQVVIIFLL